MILPDDLAPLPVSLHGDGTAGAPAVPFEDFVRVGDVRKVLLGDESELPVEGLPAEDFESFAGRSDVASPSVSRWVATRDMRLEVPDLVIEPPAIHPAFEILALAVRRAAPPRSRIVEDCEATYGRAKLSDRWWVMGMGLAAAAILFSGTAVDFISREAVRRSRSGVEPMSRVFPAEPEKAGRSADERPEAIAAAAAPDED